MSASNADEVRAKVKQHACPVLMGTMGIGKSRLAFFGDRGDRRSETARDLGDRF